MTSHHMSRAEARTAQVTTIKKVSRALIAKNGVNGLSLREVAREMGVVSSALYRYFATRDELLTALIFDAYNDLGASVERADAKVSTEDAAHRLRVAAGATRRWAKRHPHEYGLIFGTPVPDYEAPAITVDAATRVPRVLGKILSDAQSEHPFKGDPMRGDDIGEFLEVDTLATALVGVPAAMYVRALMAWNLIFGFVSFELWGHYEGSVKNMGGYFDRVLDELVELLEL